MVRRATRRTVSRQYAPAISLVDQGSGCAQTHFRTYTAKPHRTTRAHSGFDNTWSQNSRWSRRRSHATFFLVPSDLDPALLKPAQEAAHHLEELRQLLENGKKSQGPAQPPRPASTAAPPHTPPERTPVYYRYTDAEGTTHIVEATETLPNAGHEELHFPSPPSSVLKPLQQITQLVSQTTSSPSLPGIHGPSLGLGVALALGVVLLLRTPLRRWRWLWMLLAMFSTVGVSMAYFHRVRSQAGLPGAGASPAAVIQDAQRAAQEMEHRLERQHQLLDKLTASP